MSPWVDKAVAFVAVVPFIWLAYMRMRTFGFDLPRLVAAIHLVVFIGTMITRKAAVRVSTNPWFSLVRIVETHLGPLTFGFMNRGHAIAPHWMTDTLSILSGYYLGRVSAWAAASGWSSVRL
jgi:hypothetical protein